MSEETLASNLVTSIIRTIQKAWLTYEHLANLFLTCNPNEETSKMAGLNAFGRYFRLLSQRMRDNQSRWMDYLLMCDASLCAALCSPFKPVAELENVRYPIDALKLSLSIERDLYKLYLEVIKECDAQNLFELQNYVELKFLHAQARIVTCVEKHLVQLGEQHKDYTGPHSTADYMFDRLTLHPVNEEICMGLIRDELTGNKLTTIEKLELLVGLVQMFPLRESPMLMFDNARAFTALHLT